MNEADAYDAVAMALAPAMLGVPLQMPNVGFNQPEGIRWARATFHTTDTQRAALTGMNKVRAHNVDQLMVVDIFEPNGKGVMDVLRFAGTIAALFSSKTYDCVTFRSARVTPIGPDGAYYHVKVLADFYYQTLR